VLFYDEQWNYLVFINLPNRAKTGKKNRAKPSQTGLNRFCPKKPNRNRLVWTGFGLFLF
jgi:hypothetical protein